jgi:hypothetical protein
LLGVVTMEHTITAVQCLLLFRFAWYSICLPWFSLYHMWILKPSHAFNLLCTTSTKMQSLLYLRIQKPDLGTREDRELEKRAFWAVVLMEK